ncbi:MAG: hypothetical protein ACJ8J0_05795 [Longimicrobiaceae bacterium]
MPAFRRILLGLPLAAAACSLWSPPLASQGRAAERGPVPLLRAVARMSCGSARPWNLAPPRRAVTGPGSLAAQPVTLKQAELLGTLQLRFGAEPRRGTADAERPRSGSWSVAQVGYCTGGRGPLHLALLTPAAEGRPARFDLRGPATHIRRPGALRAAAEGGEVRFTGTCGRRQEVVMEIWPPAGLGVPREREPERYRLVGTVTCAGAATGAEAGGAAPAPAAAR